MNAIEFEAAPDPQDFLDFLHTHDTRIRECAARQGGHRWLIEAEPGSNPCLTCEDCPASADDLVPDASIYLEDEPYEIAGKPVDFGAPLALDAQPYVIPVAVQVELDTLPAGPWGPAEARTILIHITPREVTA